jgi:hypothetical protein
MGARIWTRGTWVAPTVRAALMLTVSVIVFLVIPNRLLGYLSVHLVPTARDLLMAVWWLIAFVFACWLFVRLQRGVQP